MTGMVEVNNTSLGVFPVNQPAKVFSAKVTVGKSKMVSPSITSMESILEGLPPMLLNSTVKMFVSPTTLLEEPVELDEPEEFADELDVWPLSRIASARVFIALAMMEPTTTPVTAIDKIPTMYRTPEFVNFAILNPPYGLLYNFSLTTYPPPTMLITTKTIIHGK